MNRVRPRETLVNGEPASWSRHEWADWFRVVAPRFTPDEFCVCANRLYPQHTAYGHTHEGWTYVVDRRDRVLARQVAYVYLTQSRTPSTRHEEVTT